MMLTRLVERLPERHRPVEAVVVVLGLPRRLRARHLHRHRLVDHDRREGNPRPHRGGVDDRLEGGPGLPERLRGAVELAVLEVAPAHHGQDVAGLRLERDRQPLQVGRGGVLGFVVALRLLLEIGGVGRVTVRPVGARLDGAQLGLERALRGLLHLEIERGVDPESVGIEPRAEPGIELLADVLDEVLRHGAEVVTRGQQERIGSPPVRFLAGDGALLRQEPEDQVAALDRAGRVPPRIVPAGRLGHGGERRRLRHVQVPGGLAEVALRRRLHAERAVAEVDLVEVELEDLVLGVLRLDFPGDAGFAQLPTDGPLLPVDVFRKEVAGQLHGDGGKPLADATGQDVGLDRAGKPDPVDAVVLVEPLVLGGQEGGDDGGGHLVQADDGAAFLAEVGDEAAVGGVHLGGLVGVVAVEPRDGGAAVAGAGPRPRTIGERGGEDGATEDGEEDPSTDFGGVPPPEEGVADGGEKGSKH